MTREEKLQKAHQMFDNRNLLTELKWQREYFRRGYVSNNEELFNIWIFDECIKALEQESNLDKINKMKFEITDSLEFWDYSPNNNPLARDMLEIITNFWGDIKAESEGV